MTTMKPALALLTILFALVTPSPARAAESTIFPPPYIYRLPATVLGPRAPLYVACAGRLNPCPSFVRNYRDGYQMFMYGVKALGVGGSSPLTYYEIHIFDNAQGAILENCNRSIGKPDATPTCQSGRANGFLRGGYNASTHQCSYTSGWVYRNVNLLAFVLTDNVQPPCKNTFAWADKASSALYQATIRYTQNAPSEPQP